MKTSPILTLVVTLAVATTFLCDRGPAELLAQPGATGGESKQSTKEKPEAPAKPKAATGTDAVAAITTLKTARESLEQYRSIKAQIIETVTIGSRRFKATGSYIQGTRESLKLRLEYHIKIGKLEGTLLEVCDGKVLWSRQKIGSDARITRRDVRQILQALKAAKPGPESALAAELGMGGIPALLASLEQTMDFNRQSTEIIDEKPFTVIHGSWKQEVLARFQAPNATASGALPDYIPERVRIYFDSQLFPRRILYLKRQSNNKYRPMVSLSLVKVVLNEPVNDKDFVFVPPDDVFQDDITKQFLQRITGAPAQPPASTPQQKP